MLATIVEAFNTANPDICVKMTIVPGAETDIAKLLTSIRGGVAPDVYMADRFTVAQRAAEGVLDQLPDGTANAAASTCRSHGPRPSTRARRTRCRSIPTRASSGTTRT